MPCSHWVDDPFGPILNLSTFDGWDEVESLLTNDKAVGLPDNRVWRIRIYRISPYGTPIAMNKWQLRKQLQELSP